MEKFVFRAPSHSDQVTTREIGLFVWEMVRRARLGEVLSIGPGSLQIDREVNQDNYWSSQAKDYVWSSEEFPYIYRFVVEVRRGAEPQVST